MEKKQEQENSGFQPKQESPRHQAGTGASRATFGETAEVVKRIFDLCIAGKGPMQIAKILKSDKVLTTKAYYAKQKGKVLPENPYGWNDISGAISHERFLKLSVEYEAEQRESSLFPVPHLMLFFFLIHFFVSTSKAFFDIPIFHIF